MPTLHTVNKSAFDRNSLESCLSVCKTDSSILLIEDAVVAAMSNTLVTEKIVCAIVSGIKLYALSEDIRARGLPPQRLIRQIRLINYSGFVDLVTHHDRVQNWL